MSPPEVTLSVLYDADSNGGYYVSLKKEDDDELKAFYFTEHFMRLPGTKKKILMMMTMMTWTTTILMMMMTLEEEEDDDNDREYRRFTDVVKNLQLFQRHGDSSGKELEQIKDLMKEVTRLEFSPCILDFQLDEGPEPDLSLCVSDQEAADFFGGFPKLNSLTLWAGPKKDDGLKSFTKILNEYLHPNRREQQHPLEQLDLANVQFTGNHQGYQSFFDALKKHRKHLKVLNIVGDDSGLGSSPYYGEVLLESISQSSMFLRKLGIGTKIDLSPWFSDLFPKALEHLEEFTIDLGLPVFDARTMNKEKKMMKSLESAMLLIPVLKTNNSIHTLRIKASPSMKCWIRESQNGKNVQVRVDKEIGSLLETNASIRYLDIVWSKSPEMQFYLDLNACGRKSLLQDDATVDHLVDALDRANDGNQHPRENTVSVIFSLLRLKPALYCPKKCQNNN